MTNVFKFSREEILDRVSTKLAAQIYDGMDAAKETDTPSNGRRTRRPRKSHTKPRDVTDQQILDLIRTKGPLRVVEIIEITGLTQSAAHKKVAALRDGGAIKEVREGTNVRYMVSRGTASARKSARKVGAKPSKASKASKASNGMAAKAASNGKDVKRPRGRPPTKKVSPPAATTASA